MSVEVACPALRSAGARSADRGGPQLKPLPGQQAGWSSRSCQDLATQLNLPLKHTQTATHTLHREIKTERGSREKDNEICFKSQVHHCSSLVFTSCFFILFLLSFALTLSSLPRPCFFCFHVILFFPALHYPLCIARTYL